MKICAVVKYPPIQGGVSAQTFWLMRGLAQAGNQVSVVTNANEVEDEYRIWIPPGDEDMLESEFESGGSVSVRFSGLHREHLTHIPYSNPFVTKLSSLAIEAARDEDCDLLYAYYYEPYGISAQLASAATGKPFVVQNAGSDRSRLMAHPELAAAYSEMLRRASIVITGGRLFERLGVAPWRLEHGWLKTMLPEEWFRPDGEALDFDALMEGLVEAGHPWVTNQRPLRDGVPTVGVYGKVGDVKGSFDLVHALARLKRKGHRFNFLAMVGGRDRADFVRAVDDASLADFTWFIPFLPHWRVPGFIRLCTCVCFLERHFPVAFHAPSLPEEILACAGCAVLSREAADKQRFADELESAENAFIVEDPEDIDSLARAIARAIEDPGEAERVGRNGRALVEQPALDQFSRFYSDIFDRALGLGLPSDDDLQHHEGGQKAPEAVVDAVVGFVTDQMPATAQVLADAFGERSQAEAQRLVEGRAGRPGPLGQLALEVAEALVATADADDDYAGELARFERNSLWLSVPRPSDEPAAHPPAIAAIGGQAIAPFEKRRPLIDPRLRTDEFRYDVERAVEAALNGDGELPRTVLAEPVIYLWHKRGNLIGRRYKINARTKRLLELCDGTRTVANLEALLAGRNGLEPTLRQLARAQVVALV